MLVSQARNIKNHLHHRNNFMFPMQASQENELSANHQCKAQMWYRIATKKRSWGKSLGTSRIITKSKTFLWRGHIPLKRTATQCKSLILYLGPKISTSLLSHRNQLIMVTTRGNKQRNLKEILWLVQDLIEDRLILRQMRGNLVGKRPQLVRMRRTLPNQ